MAEFDFDLFVIGGGSGGVRAARVSSELGVRVALCEERYLGGTCVNVGCVPKKLFVYGSHFAEDFRDARAFGWDANKNREIERLNGIYERLLLEAGVTVLGGRARITGPQQVEVGPTTYTAERIVVATGAWPWVPDMPGAELGVTSNELFHMKTLPKSICVVGGGYIGVEFAGIFNGMGVEVTLIQRSADLLTRFDHDVRAHLAAELRKKGVKLMLGQQVTGLRDKAPRREVVLSDGEAVTADMVLCATGRRANTAELGLEALDVELDDRGAVVVNEAFQSTVPSIYAVGDVIDRYQLTPVALTEGMALAHQLFGEEPFPMDYDTIPTAIFSQPPIATVGLTEQDARDTLEQVDVYRSTFTPLKSAMSGREERTLVKLVVDAKTDRVVGCHMVGPDAPEVIQGLAVALKAGATKAHFDRTIGIHPTAAEEFVTMGSPVS